ncbi:hypothetical protein SETIT_2G170900v2, partial [Setaria italica]
DETISHLLLGCVFAREFWFKLLQTVGQQALAPQIGEVSFDDWWERAVSGAGEQLHKGLNSLIILGAWILWNHRNRCVFDGVSPNLARALMLAGEELHVWGLAGARGISYLLTLRPD